MIAALIFLVGLAGIGTGVYFTWAVLSDYRESGDNPLSFLIKERKKIAMRMAIVFVLLGFPIYTLQMALLQEQSEEPRYSTTEEQSREYGFYVAGYEPIPKYILLRDSSRIDILSGWAERTWGYQTNPLLMTTRIPFPRGRMFSLFLIINAHTARARNKNKYLWFHYIDPDGLRPRPTFGIIESNPSDREIWVARFDTLPDTVSFFLAEKHPDSTDSHVLLDSVAFRLAKEQTESP